MMCSKNNSTRRSVPALPAILFALLILTASSAAFAQTTAFTYQGRLSDGANSSPTGSYDLQFTLYDANGAAVGSPTAREDVTVTNGVFTVSLDFGAAAFDGSGRTLEIAVRRGTETGEYTTLSPRQSITSTPYAIRALNAAAADTATTATTSQAATNAQQLGGVAASQFTQNNSQAFIRNQTTQQTADFNISGTGAANILNAGVQYNIGGNRVLSVTGTNNLFAGTLAGNSNTAGSRNSFFGSFAGFSNTTGANNSFVGTLAGQSNTTGTNNSFVGVTTGQSNTTGINNSFFGAGAGQFNTTGYSNSFVGVTTGQSNTTGFNNSFVGVGAGQSNTTGANNSFVGVASGLSNTTGANNSFVGLGAGQSNTTGGNNTIIGYEANVGSGGLTFATALGANAVVSTSNTVVLGRTADTVRIPGNLIVAGSLTAAIDGANVTNLNANNISAGTLSIARGGTGSATQNFVDLTSDQTIAGDKTFSNPVNTTTQFNIGGNRVLSINGANNVFVGAGAGFASTTGSQNTFVGQNAGLSNTSGRDNLFVGFNAGLSNTTGSANTVIGVNADVASDNLNFATAIGAGANVSTDNTIALGRSNGSDKVRIFGLGAAGSTSLCRNADNEISTCTQGNFAERNQADAEQMNALREQVRQQDLMIRQQQIVIDGLKKLVCVNNPTADICK